MGVKEEAGERKEKPAAQCNSVECEPVNFLVQHPEDAVRDIFPPAQLHNVILVVNLIVDYAVQLHSRRAVLWMRAVGVSPNLKHGSDKIAFVGNECQTLVTEESTVTLKNMLPPLARLDKVLSDASKPAADRNVAQTFFCLHLLCAVLQALDCVIQAVTTPNLFPGWETAISDFANSWSEFKREFGSYRELDAEKTDITPPRVFNILTEIPIFIRKYGTPCTGTTNMALKPCTSSCGCLRPNTRYPVLQRFSYQRN